MKKISIFLSLIVLIVASLACVLPTPPSTDGISAIASATPTVVPSITPSSTTLAQPTVEQPAVSTATIVPTNIPTLTTVVGSGSGDVQLIDKASDALSYPYPSLVVPNPSRQTSFPNPLAEYLPSWESNDYFHDDVGDVDVPQWSYRAMTSGRIEISQLGIDCTGDTTTTCGAIIINHFGPTYYAEDATVDTGFTVVGLVFDMSTPEKVSVAAQALLDHYTYRVTGNPDGSNCSTRDACAKFIWHVVVVGNGAVQQHWTGVYIR